MSVQSENTNVEMVAHLPKMQPLLEHQVLPENKPEASKRHSLRKKIWAALIGVPSVVLSMGLSSYYYFHREPVRHGISIHRLLMNIYHDQDPKLGFMGMIDDSSYDQTTKSFLIAAANAYKDTIEESGSVGVTEKIEEGLLTPPIQLNEILTEEDEVTRRNMIIAESSRIRTIERIIEVVQSEYVQEEIQLIIDSQSPQMTIDEVQNQRYYKNGLPQQDLELEYQEFSQLTYELPTQIQDRLFRLLSETRNTTYSLHDENRSLNSKEMHDIVNSIIDYYQQHGTQETLFLLNIITYDFGFEIEFMTEDREHALLKLRQLYRIFETFSPEALDFFTGSAQINIEYIGPYRKIFNTFFQTNDNLILPPQVDEVFYEITSGDKLVATILFFDYYFSAYLGKDGDHNLITGSADEFIRYSRVFELIKKYNLNTREIAYLFDIFGGVTFGWDEVNIQLVKEHPFLLNRANPRFFYLGLLEQNKVNLSIYRVLTSKYSQLPPVLSPEGMMNLDALSTEIFRTVGTVYTVAELSAMLETEVKEFDNFKVAPTELDFSLDTNAGPSGVTAVEVPLILRGQGDNFIVFDEHQQNLAQPLTELSFDQLLDQLRGFHFLYIKDGVMKFGSIAEELEKVPASGRPSNEIFVELRKIGITKLIRTLPIHWNGDDINFDSHARRVDSEEFTGIILVTDQASRVKRQYLVSIPTYQIQNLTRSKLGQYTKLQSQEQVELLLPDAGFRALIWSHGDDAIFSHGEIAGNDQMVTFFPKKE